MEVSCGDFRGRPEFERLLYPDWREYQRRTVEDVCATKKARVCVAEVDGTAVGFVAIEVYNPERSMGQISMLAVDPDHQGGGIGTAFALDRLKDAGMKVAMVKTGREPGHAAPHVRKGRLRPPSDR
ncbi:MAG TPA: GNAT family N-acetyltransferase [Rubrobacter sp.]|nr:GNAT family N-acetyltransferase [Rubrobacter sp.]